MKLLPFSTLPTRAKSRIDEYVLWPLKTTLVAWKDKRTAQKKEGFVPTTILFYPEAPKTYHTLYKVCNYLGWDITTNPHKHADVRIFFEDTTVRNTYTILETLKTQYPIVNINSTDISKEHVEKIFSEAFGYSMDIDPETHEGVCVRKSNINAVHDGKIVTCPTQREEGYVYQKLIDTKQDDGRVMDLRLHMFNGISKVTLKRYKNADDMFDITVDAEFVNYDEVLSKEEQEKVSEFCKKMGLDYGELDVMRDNNDSKLYIVDVNNTPAGPAGPLYENLENYDKWFEEIAQEVKNTFLPTSSK